MRDALLALVIVLNAGAAAEPQQQGSVQVSTDTQVIAGNTIRRATERTWEPDFGALWSQPGSWFSRFELELRGSRRGEDIHLGRAWFALRDAKKRGVSWTLQGGDLYATHALNDYRFSNLAAPSITFTGASVAAKSKTTTFEAIAGHSTALRNIFGTDPDTLGQALALARGSYAPGTHLTLNGRASRVRTTNLKEFTRTIDAGDQAGGGAQLVVTPSFYLVADGSYVRYRATGSASTVKDYSYLGGAHLLLSRGWIQFNASRFSPGDVPVLNASLQDRSGLFAAGEIDVLPRVRLFGGWENTDSNINPTGAALQRPMSNATRQFGGVRVRVTSRSTLSFRREEGDRVARPIVASRPLLFGTPATSDTGAMAAELQTTIGRLTAFGRYARRENVDGAFASASYTQHDGAAQLFLNVSRKTQLFGIASLTNNRTAIRTGSTFLQATAGGQQQIFRPGLWLRMEGSMSRNQDLTTRLLAPRDALSVGLNGQLSTHTTIGVNVYADRAPIGFPGDPNAWLTRSTVRIVHTIPTGSVRVASSATGTARAARGTGTIAGSVFADWNANGQPDPGEEVLAGIPVALGTISHVTTAHDGQFAFLNVPAGVQKVRLDLDALPVDFDAPAASEVSFEVGRGETRRVAFGLLPLGVIRGRVFEDANKNGQLDPTDPPVDGAVFVLDGGQRSELAHKGQFRFDAVRAGGHKLELLKESLPEGSTIVDGTERDASITRERSQLEVTYLVTIEKRPEVRKVFPSRGGGAGAATAAAASGRSTAPSSRTPAGRGRGAAPTPAPRMSAPRASAPRVSLLVPPAAGTFTVQVAALANAANARTIAAELKKGGFAAYLVEPAAGSDDTLYRVRVGRFTSRAQAQRTVERLENWLGLKMWVTRVR